MEDEINLGRRLHSLRRRRHDGPAGLVPQGTTSLAPRVNSRYSRPMKKRSEDSNANGKGVPMNFIGTPFDFPAASEREKRF
jgi:hypothetical protein